MLSFSLFFLPFVVFVMMGDIYTHLTRCCSLESRILGCGASPDLHVCSCRDCMHACRGSYPRWRCWTPCSCEVLSRVCRQWCWHLFPMEVLPWGHSLCCVACTHIIAVWPDISWTLEITHSTAARLIIRIIVAEHRWVLELTAMLPVWPWGGGAVCL